MGSHLGHGGLVSASTANPNESQRMCWRANPKIVEAAVIGVPDEHSGEAVAAYIVRRDESPDARGSAGILPARTSPATRFRDGWNSADSLPKTNVGKMLPPCPARGGSRQG